LHDASTATFTISEGNTAPAGFVLHEDGSWSFDPTDSDYDHLNVGDSAALTIPVTVTDNKGGKDAVQIQLTVVGTNDAPVIGGATTGAVTEDVANALATSGQLTISDADAGESLPSRPPPSTAASAPWISMRTAPGITARTAARMPSSNSASMKRSLTPSLSPVPTVPNSFCAPPGRGRGVLDREIQTHGRYVESIALDA
jgi:VCBS repeat-containing protein